MTTVWKNLIQTLYGNNKVIINIIDNSKVGHNLDF